MSERGEVVRLRFPRALTSQERIALQALLEESGAMILASDPEAGRRAGQPLRFGSAPSLSRLTASEGLRDMLAYVHRPSAELASESTARLFMRLGAAFASARFTRFVPGGTPERSAEELARMMKD